MKIELLQEKLPLPQGVSASVSKSVMTVKGKGGEASKKIGNQLIVATVNGNEIVISCKNATKKEKMHFYTAVSHAKNLLEGAQKPFEYELKICSGHFPMTASVKGTQFELKNFLGESIPRKIKLKEGAKVTVEGEFIKVVSPNIELASQVAADLESVTRITDRDRRVFQDGIYITKKAGKPV